MLLAVDTSTRNLGVALYDGVRVVSETVWLSQNHHTVELAPAVKNHLKWADIEADDLDAVAVAIGPGSFTGLRIGLSFSKGLALSQKIAIIGISTLETLAYGQPVTDINLAATLQAGRGRLAVAWYKAESGKWTPNGDMQNLTHELFIEHMVTPATLCGELDETLVDSITRKYSDVNIAPPALSLRRPSFLAELAWQKWKSGNVDDPTTLKPIYLHHGDPILDV